MSNIGSSIYFFIVIQLNKRKKLYDKSQININKLKKSTFFNSYKITFWLSWLFLIKKGGKKLRGDSFWDFWAGEKYLKSLRDIKLDSVSMDNKPGLWSREKRKT